VVVGGFGSTSDPYRGVAVGRTPNGNDVFACDSDPLNAAAVSAGGAATALLVRIDPDTQAAYDQETAAIAREAAARGLPFIAFRASSDGGDDGCGCGLHHAGGRIGRRTETGGGGHQQMECVLKQGLAHDIRSCGDVL
jgi:hypothetical protein